MASPDSVEFAVVRVLGGAEDGRLGQTIEFLPEEEKWLVKTFTGEIVTVSQDELKPYTPPSPFEQGGFDVAFPETQERSDFFTTELLEKLDEKKYCVVQCSVTPEENRAAVNSAEDAANWMRLVPDFENDMIGRSGQLKKLQWASDATPEEGGDPGMYKVVSLLNDMGTAILALGPSLGFDAGEQSNVLMTSKCTEDEQDDYFKVLEEDDNKVVDAREVRDFMAFASRRKACMIYFAGASGGTLTLHSMYEEAPDIVFPCRAGQLISFMADELDFTYLPADGQMAIQSWVLRAKFKGEEGALIENFDENTLAIIDEIPSGPLYGDTGETVDVMALSPKLPGQVWDGGHYFSLLGSGGDGIVTVPILRWDHDVYYTDSGEPGKCYCKHIGFITQDQISLFDNEFFGISDYEAFCMDPPARNMLECGYEALSRGGWNKKTVKGQRIAMAMGFQESEFTQMALRGQFGVTADIKTQQMASAVSARVHFCLGTVGPSVVLDTACSSSLYAVNLVHAWLRPNSTDAVKASMRKQASYGVGFGGNAYMDPWATIGCCGASMLTHNGRCFTFDATGDGYVRAEGQAAMYMKVSHSEDFARLAMICGTCMNQDGRSASLTAPHGPSQQECIRYSLREANIDPLKIRIQELHGTGTALGDPIEVGALRATMMTYQGTTRSHPLVKTSAKTNVGHGEHVAGINGIMKCVLLSMMATAAPNNHLRLLNAHVDSNGYPVFFTSEFTDQGMTNGYCGVSSFGFSGCNARGDIWGRCLSGPRNTNPGSWATDFTYQRIVDFARIFGHKEVKDIKTKSTQADMYELVGDFMLGDPRSSDHTFYIEGSFNGWGTGVKMEENEETGVFVMPIVMGDALVEQFVISVNEYSDAKIFPAGREGGLQDKVVGPGKPPLGHYWVIDGRADKVTPGTVYVVSFWYDEQTRQKKVFWEPTTDEDAIASAAGKDFKHPYYIRGSWASFNMTPMRNMARGVFETSFVIGAHGHEEFNLTRDGQLSEVIYPSVHRPATTECPLRGPDFCGDKKLFGVVGETGEKVLVRLQTDGALQVSIEQGASCKTWSAADGFEGVRFSISSTWSKKPIPMAMIAEGVFVANIQMTYDDFHAFQIIKDDDDDQAIHPEMEFAALEQSKAMGPDHQGQGLQWYIEGFSPQTSVAIRLDLMAADRRKVVTWAEGDSAGRLSLEA